MCYFFVRLSLCRFYAIYIMHTKVQKKNDICNYPVIFCVILLIFFAFGTFFVVF